MPGRVIEHRAFMGPQLHNHSEGIIQYLEFRYLGYCLPIRPNRSFPNRFRLYCIYTHLGKREGGVLCRHHALPTSQNCTME